MNKFEDTLTKYGVDYKTTMNRFLNKDSLYLNILGSFFQDENLKLLKMCLCNAQLEDAFKYAHTLKGVTANLGLAPMYDSICQMVECLRKKDLEVDYQELLLNVELEYKKVEELYNDLKNNCI